VLLAPFQRGALSRRPSRSPWWGPARHHRLGRSAPLVRDRHAQAHRRTPPDIRSRPPQDLRVAADRLKCASIIRSATACRAARHGGFHASSVPGWIDGRFNSCGWLTQAITSLPWVVGEQLLGDRPGGHPADRFGALKAVFRRRLRAEDARTYRSIMAYVEASHRRGGRKAHRQVAVIAGDV